MSLRTLGALQWIGLLGGAGAWAAQHVVGYGLTEAQCHAGGAAFGIANDPWQAALMATAIACILAAGAAGVAVLLRTREATYEDGPPVGRIRMLAIAAVAANAIFLMIVVLSGSASLVVDVCRQG
jgi:hypothetical protein